MIAALALWLALPALSTEFTETLGGSAYRAWLTPGDVKIYLSLKGKEYMIFTHPSPGDTPQLEPLLTQKRLADRKYVVLKECETAKKSSR